MNKNQLWLHLTILFSVKTTKKLQKTEYIYIKKSQSKLILYAFFRLTPIPFILSTSKADRMSKKKYKKHSLQKSSSSSKSLAFDQPVWSFFHPSIFSPAKTTGPRGRNLRLCSLNSMTLSHQP